MKQLILLTALLFSLNAFSQKKPLIELGGEVTKAASAHFDESMSGPEGELYLFGNKNNIQGTYDFRITLGDRGKVVSIFVLNREGGSVKMQNMVKDEVKAAKFGFKLPKNKNYSFEYKFNF